MPFFYDEASLPFVQEQIRNAGGSISHNDLVNALQNAGRQSAAQSLLAYAQAGLIVSSVKARAEGAPLLTYSLPA